MIRLQQWGRKLKQWIHQPLATRSAIESRLEIVTDLLEEYFVRTELQTALKQVYDLERLAGRVAFGNVGGVIWHSSVIHYVKYR